MVPTTNATHRKSSLAFKGSYRNRNSGFGTWVDREHLVTNTAEIWSVSNGKGPYSHPFRDIGGFFHLRSTRWEIMPAVVNRSTMIGPALIGTPVSYIPLGPVEPSEAKLFSDGATLISRALPTSSDFSLATFAGELKEGLPSIVGSSFVRDQTKILMKLRTRRGIEGNLTKIRGRAASKSLGGEFLNVEFGWKPIISDVRKFAHAVISSSEFIKDHQRTGRISARRRRSLPEISTTYTSTSACNPNPTSVGYFEKCHFTDTRVENTWFSGAFKYSVPIGDTQMSKILLYEQRANLLLGTRLTPEVLWNLAPWSWAIDWFTNTGDIMKNISLLGSDRLAMHYGYVMASSVATRESKGNYPGNGPPARTKRTSSVKTRRRASPYGFGGSWDGMTPRQIAIATSLGLSRA